MTAASTEPSSHCERHSRFAVDVGGRTSGTVPVNTLTLGPSIRDHASQQGPLRTPSDPAFWPPIVVTRETRTVIDGHRRVRAAMRMGVGHLAVRWFDGDETDAVVEFVRLNMRQDDELARSERRDAARQILERRPDWSDRRIADLCHISPKSVAEVRLVLRQSGSALMGAEARVGRDGRIRPLDSRAQRARIVAAIQENPRASLRVIARPIGASPETVRRVRTAMTAAGSLDGDAFAPVELVQPFYLHRREPTWQPDVSFTSRDEAAEVAEFLQRTDISTVDPEEHSRAIPLSRVYEVADEARRRAAFWQRLAELVESRVRKACH